MVSYLTLMRGYIGAHGASVCEHGIDSGEQDVALILLSSKVH